MADGDCIAQLGGWVGYRVEDWRHEWRGERRWLVLELTPEPASRAERTLESLNRETATARTADLWRGGDTSLQWVLEEAEMALGATRRAVVMMVLRNAVLTAGCRLIRALSWRSHGSSRVNQPAMS